MQNADAPPSARAPAFPAASRTWAVVGTIALVLALLYDASLFIPGEPARAAREAFGGWAIPIVAALAALAALHTAGTMRGETGARAWVLIGTALSLSTVGEILFYVTGQPDLSIADAFYLAYYPIMLAGLLKYPASRRTSRAAFALDALIAGLGGAVVMWYFVIGPVAAAGMIDPGSTALSLAVNVAYPVGDLLLLLGLATVMLRTPAPVGRIALWAIVGGVIPTMIANGHYLLRTLAGTYEGGTLSDVLFLTGWAGLLGAATLRQRAGMRQLTVSHTGIVPFFSRVMLRVADSIVGSVQRRGYSVLPYASVASAYTVLLLATRPLWTSDPKGTFGAGAVVFGTLLVTVAVVARQIVAMRENVQGQRVLAREQAAREGEARFRALVQCSADVVFILDAAGVVRYVSPALAREFGHAPEAMLDRLYVAQVHPEEVPSILGIFSSLLAEPSGSATLRHRLQHADGKWRQVESIASNMLGDAAVAGIVFNVRDVTERHGLEAQLAHQAFHDSLTGLPNRALFRDRVQHAMQRREQAGTATLAVLFLDLDDFKSVNDSLGHHAGDELLVQVARRLLAATRGSDTVARLGGDEFAVLIDEAGDEGNATLVAERIGRALSQAFTVAGRPARVGCSIGIARPTDDDGEPELLRNADVAMYCAKRRGLGGFVVFEATMHEEVVQRVEIERALRDALAPGASPADAGLWVAYQPIIDLETGTLVGAEALVRWDRGELGSLSPIEFIPIAEDTGLIIPLGRWVLAEACTQAALWPATAAPLRVNVNLSGRQLEDAGLLHDVNAVLEETQFDPRRLTFEVTESTLMQDTENVALVLGVFRKQGIKVALDDFGTGYSSLSYLHRMPVDVLKIDKSFIDRIDRGGPEAALARSILMLGESLGLRAVAEGVETEAQRDVLREFGCPLAQGFWFARPLTSVQFVEFAVSAARDGLPMREIETALAA